MIEIREMNIEDFEKIKNILVEQFDDFWSPNLLKSEIENESSKCLVALENENILGFASFIITIDEVDITNIVTKKTERKKGIGKLLLDKIIEMTKKIGIKKIYLEVNEKNTIAINLYKLFNFEQIGIRKKYYNGIDNAIIMLKKI